MRLDGLIPARQAPDGGADCRQPAEHGGGGVLEGLGRWVSAPAAGAFPRQPPMSQLFV